jgi:hypothetical protein
MSTKRQGRPAARQGKPGAGTARGGPGPRQPGGKQGGKQGPPPGGRPVRPGGNAGRPAGAPGRPGKPGAAGRPGAGRGGPGKRQPVVGAGPAGTGTRAMIERRSALPLVFMRQMPAWAVPLLLAGLLVAGLALRGWAGAALLGVLAVLIGWLGYLSWPVLTPAGRLMRVLMVLAPLLIAVLQFGR